MVSITIVSFFLLSARLAMALDNMPPDGSVKNLFPLTLIHINDFHARYEETTLKSKVCPAKDYNTGKCIAGIARVYYMIKKLLNDYKQLNPIYLNAGDNYQGTLWYNLLRWEVTAEFIKKLKPSVMTFGNHEFDHGLKGLKPYLDELEKANIQTVIANMNLNKDKELSQSKLPKSTVLTVNGQKIGVIGVLYDKTHEVAQTGGVTFYSSVNAVKSEAAALKQKGIKIIVVLSHCSLDEDKKIAREAGNDIDVIVGAHSHSFLYSKESKMPYDKKNDVIEGPYPVLVENGAKRKVLIVQAKAYGKYVGRLTLYFDQDGNVKHWEGFPVFINGSVPQDPSVAKDMIRWREKVQEIGSTVIGRTEVELERDPCRDRECTLGVVVADAFADHYTNQTFKPIAFIQAGNFRNPIEKGDITNGDIIEAAPFGSTVDLIKIKGQNIWDAAEHSYTWDDENRTNCLQVSGLRIVIDANKEFYKRVVSIQVRGYRSPKQETYQKLDPKAEYYVALPSYLADGKDGFVALSKSLARWKGPLDSDVFKAYVQKVRVIKNLSLGRVEIRGKTNISRRK
ncbi:apyrase-like [Wyeomyia smithii]|uniref:apyrase-like n=1 Tax=Wyeomyia smithii TaxID=174621 RepID=UPI002467E056|nr:apyrase-like [Wyeomyia smithii]